MTLLSTLNFPSYHSSLSLYVNFPSEGIFIVLLFTSNFFGFSNCSLFKLLKPFSISSSVIYNLKNFNFLKSSVILVLTVFVLVIISISCPLILKSLYSKLFGR